MGAGFIHRFTDINVYETGSVKMRAKLATKYPQIYGDIFASVYVGRRSPTVCVCVCVCVCVSLMFADYRTQRSCLSSPVVTADSNKCYVDFQRRLSSIVDDTNKRHPHAYVCLLSYVRCRRLFSSSNDTN